jgi:hypothetical protein
LRPFFANAVKDLNYSKIKVLTAKFAKKSRKERKRPRIDLGLSQQKARLSGGLPEVLGLWFDGKTGFFP